MSVVVGIDATPLLGRLTGIGRFVDGLIGSLGGRSDVTLRGFGLTGSGWRQLGRTLPPGVGRSRAPLPAGAALALWSRLDAPPIEWWTGRLDVIHGTNFVVPPTRRAARLVTVHDLTPLLYPELCEPAALRYPRLVRRAVAGGAWVHTPSEAMAAETVEHLGASPERVRVIPPGITLAPRTLGAARPPGPPYVLALGTVEPRKDLPSLVAAFDAIAGAHPDLRLKIAGPAGWGERALGAAIAAAHHRERIDRLGWVAEREELLAGAHVFAYPSLYEGFGVPPVEAMAEGVPVVATAVGAVPEVVGDAALLVAPRDADALGAALARVLDDDRERDRLVAAGRQQVGRYRWDRFGDAMAALYRELAAEGRR